MQATPGPNADIRAQVVALPHYVVRNALIQAEQAVDDLSARIRQASGQRDRVVEDAGNLQTRINVMTVQLENLTRQVRELKGAME